MAHNLTDLLLTAVSQKASDLHINAGFTPQVRIDGTLHAAADTMLTAEDAQEICYECLNQEQVMRLEQERSIDLSFGIEARARFRANIFWSLGTVAGSFRVIPYEITEPALLGLPKGFVKVFEKPRGLVIVAGHASSGKSTTMASLIEQINRTRSDHIITIEDPIEYIYTQKKCVINQREIGPDAPSFAAALRQAQRQDPDLLLISEVRDLETLQAMLIAADTGHLVFAAMRTTSAEQTIDHLINTFPAHQQAQVRTQLSFVLEGIVCQQLLPRKGGGLALALEMLLPDQSIRNMIREGSPNIALRMKESPGKGEMVTMDQSLATLVRDGIVELEDARRHCVNVQEFEAALGKRQ